jgi:glycyl-tRNA synthetase
MENNLMEKIMSLCKRRGFIFPSSEIYGGLANSWDFGPLGVQMKNNIKNEWWRFFVSNRLDILGIDSSIIINSDVWEASGHVSGFSDPLIECKDCHRRFRIDHLIGEENYKKIEKLSEKEKKEGLLNFNIKCPNCGKKSFTDPRNFNLMMKTFLGPVNDESGLAYLRPETAQGIFINFNNIVDSSRKKIPFGIAQIGKAFRNEITPGNYIFRTREFEQMEIEYFINQPKKDSDWQIFFEEWREEMNKWISYLGIKKENVKEVDVKKEDLAHYSKKTIDFEYNFPFGLKELYGLAYRTDFDLKNHEHFSKKNTKYKDQLTGEEYWPHVIEPTFGVERTLLAVLVESFKEEKINDDTRVVMKFPLWIAPIKASILPLVKNNPNIIKKSKEIYSLIKEKFICDYDESGTIGKRYRRQDEIGTPFAITIDFDSLDNDDVTVRDRDTMTQERVRVKDLEKYLSNKINA